MGKRGVGIPTVSVGNKSSRLKRMSAIGIDIGSMPVSRGPGSTATSSQQDTAVGRLDQPKARTVTSVAPKNRRPSDFITDSEQALVDYEKDKFSAGSWTSQASVADTWKSYFEKAVRLNHGISGDPMFPLTPVLVANIAALMKLDGFRPFGNYLSWAKREHIRRGHEWSTHLALEAKDAGRSVSRGMGPTRQSASFVLEDVAELDSSVADQRAHRPVFIEDFVLLGSLWVMREIEVAWAIRSDITVNDAKKIVSWLVPVSKTDPAAKACVRSWGCLCERFGRRLCPYHRWGDYILKLERYFLDKGIAFSGDSPVFPDSRGQVIKKVEAVSAIEACMIKLGSAVADGGGRRLYGGHSMRVAGSRFWAACGLELFKLQIFARWGSQCILRYVSDAPLANVTGDVLGSSSVVVESVPDRSVAKLLEAHIRDAMEQFHLLKTELANIDHRLNPSFVQNANTKTWHKVLTGGSSMPPCAWRSRCGWPFGWQLHVMTGSVPPVGSKLCDNCFRTRLMASGSVSDHGDSGGD